MHIFIRYLKVGETTKHELLLKPADYFDSLAAGENYWDNGIAKFLSVHEYLSVRPCDLKWVEVRQESELLVRVLYRQYLDGDNVMTQHTVDEFGNEELITSSLVAVNTYHTVRMMKKSESKNWSTYVNVIDEDGESYSSTQLIKSWKFEELLNYSSE